MIRKTCPTSVRNKPYQACSQLRLRVAQLLLLLGLVACSDTARRSAEISAQLPSTAPEVEVMVSPAPAADPRRDVVERVPLLEPVQEIETGSGAVASVATAGISSGSDSEARDIVLNFQAADIQEVAKVVLGDLLGLNYLIDPAVSGTVTTETSAGLRRSELLPVLEVLLSYNNAALVTHGEMVEIIPSSRAIRAHSPLRSDYVAGAGHAMHIYPLRYIGVEEMQKILEPVLAEGALVYADPRRNLLILAGNRMEQAQYRQTVASFDVNWMAGMSVGLFRLKAGSPDDIAAEIAAALGDDSGKVMSGLVRLVEIERLNALLAISPSEDALVEVRRWIKRLDVAGDTREPRLYVLRLQNAKAVDVAAILAQLFTDNTNSSAKLGKPRLAPGNRAEEVMSESFAANEANAAPAARQLAPMLQLEGEGAALNVGSDVRVIADETNNALVIMATPRDYELMAQAIQKLDIVPLQVLIEATIVEVTLNDSLEYGVEWFFKNGFGPGKAGRGLLDLGAPGVGTLTPAFSYAVIDGLENVRVVLNALETESNVDILSSPSLMVLDNQTASINVGDEIPVPTSQSVSNLDSAARTVNEIQFRNTGVSLQVTPRVNAGGLVTMEIEQEVSDAIPTTSSDLNAPTIQQRRIASTVAVQSGQTIVLGGLIRESRAQNESGVPFIRGIPVIGKLFGNTSDQSQRTELLVLITPRAVADNREAQSVTDEYVQKMRTLR